MFDGAYKSRANVSLRGSSRKEESKEALLAQTQQVCCKDTHTHCEPH